MMKQVEKKTWNKSVFFTYFAPKARLEELLVLEEGGEDRSEKSIEDSMPDGVVKDIFLIMIAKKKGYRRKRGRRSVKYE